MKLGSIVVSVPNSIRIPLNGGSVNKAHATFISWNEF